MREKYGLDAVVAGETDEWKRILRLRNWIHTHIKIENDNPTRTRRRRSPFWIPLWREACSSALTSASCRTPLLNSFGYVTRRLGADRD